MMSKASNYYELVQSSPNLFQPNFTTNPANSSSSSAEDQKSCLKSSLAATQHNKSNQSISFLNNNTNKKRRISGAAGKIKRRVSFAEKDYDEEGDGGGMTRSKSTTTLLLFNAPGAGTEVAHLHPRYQSPKRNHTSRFEAAAVGTVQKRNFRLPRNHFRQQQTTPEMNRHCQDCMVELSKQVERTIHAYKMVTSEDDPHLAPEERDQLGRALIHGFVEIQSRITSLLCIGERSEPEGERRESIKSSSGPSSTSQQCSPTSDVVDPVKTALKKAKNQESKTNNNSFSIDPQYLEDISNILLQMVQRKLQSSAVSSSPSPPIGSSQSQSSQRTASNGHKSSPKIP